MDTLLGAAIAGLFTLLGVLLSQRHQVEMARREEQRQRLAWVRDDAARSYEQLRDAYLAFAAQWRRHHHMAFNYRELAYEGPDPDYDWMDDAYEAFVQVQVFGTRAAIEAAESSLNTLNDYAQSGKPLEYARFEQFQQAVRQDLGVPDEPVASALPFRT